MKIVSGLNGNREEIMREIMAEINDFLDHSRECLAKSPGDLRKVELRGLHMCMRILGKLIALLLASKRVGQTAMEAGMAKLPAHLRCGGMRRCNLVLPGRVKIRVETRYCPPRAPAGAGAGRRGPEGGGVYPELAALGVFEGFSPLMADMIMRLAVSLPSYDLARKELEFFGQSFNVKTIARVVRDFGGQALSARNAQLEAWRRGELPPGEELAGRRVVAGVDGGRIRIRDEKRRTRRGKRCRYKTPWREPYLLIIYTLTPQGTIERKYDTWLDATLGGVDAALELLAFHLHRLGAKDAQVVEFVNDGAPGIWNRIDQVIAMAGLDPGRCCKVLDFYHASEHLSRALDIVGLQGKEKKRRFTWLKRLLKKGKTEEVIGALYRYKIKLRRGSRRKELQKEIGYLEKRVHLMQYGRFMRKHLALGSGAVESGIRRVINLRLKGPAIYWDEDTAEVMLHLRCQLLSGQWNRMPGRIREHSKVSRRRDIHFTPTTLKRPKTAA